MENQDTVETAWNNVIILYNKETADVVLGFRKKRDKQWIIPDAWRKIDERSKAKDNLVCVKSPRLTQCEKEVYKIKEVKKSARRDKGVVLEKASW